MAAARCGQPSTHAASTLVFDLGAVSFSDVGGATFLAAVEAAHGDAAQLIGAQERVQALLLRARAATAAPVPRRDRAAP